FEKCCKHGDVKIEKLTVLPEPLNSLMSGMDACSKQFRQGIRQWNNLFAFTSIRYNMDDCETAQGGGLQLFQVHGEIYHLQGPLVPPAGRDSLYSQVYLYDPMYATESHAAYAQNL
ncbi:hypothetical protein L873DRAFT_1612912, partial [Choiromyces venosus 120613-1]